MTDAGRTPQAAEGGGTSPTAVRGQPGPAATTDLAGLRRIGVWIPVLCLSLPIGLVWIIASTPGVGWPVHLAGYLLLMGTITLGAHLFSSSIFGIVREKEGELLRRNHELAAMNDVGSVTNGALNLDEVLSRTLDVILRVTRADAGTIFLRDAATDGLSLRTVRALDPGDAQRIAGLRSTGELVDRIAETGRAVVVRSGSEGSPGDQGSPFGRGLESYAGVPLRSRGEVIGVLGVFTSSPGGLTAEDVELLDGLGNPIAVAIENARLDSQLEAMTVVQERQRIAREMHDGLAQQLGFLHLKAGELEMNPCARPLLTDIRLMKKVIARAYEEVRHAIFGLKTISLGMELVPTLAEYVREFGEQTGIDVELSVRDEAGARFPPPVEAQLTRIVQEALSNVRKHAGAEHAWVTFETDEAGASLMIRDDGRGFDRRDGGAPGRPSFGLQTMRERAEAVGGELRVESEPGKGTQVIFQLPAAR